VSTTLTTLERVYLGLLLLVMTFSAGNELLSVLDKGSQLPKAKVTVQTKKGPVVRRYVKGVTISSEICSWLSTQFAEQESKHGGRRTVTLRYAFKIDNSPRDNELIINGDTRRKQVNFIYKCHGTGNLIGRFNYDDGGVIEINNCGNVIEQGDTVRAVNEVIPLVFGKAMALAR